MFKPLEELNGLSANINFTLILLPFTDTNSITLEHMGPNESTELSRYAGYVGFFHEESITTEREHTLL